MDLPAQPLLERVGVDPGACRRAVAVLTASQKLEQDARSSAVEWTHVLARRGDLEGRTHRRRKPEWRHPLLLLDGSRRKRPAPGDRNRLPGDGFSVAARGDWEHETPNMELEAGNILRAGDASLHLLHQELSDQHLPHKAPVHRVPAE
jgi:hypothetical protein